MTQRPVKHLPLTGFGENGRGIYGDDVATFGQFRAALARARAGGSPLHIACYGDSFTNGYLDQPQEVTAYPTKLRSILGDRWGSIREGIITFGQLRGRDSRLTTTADWNIHEIGGPSGQAVYQAVGGGTLPLTFGPVTCDSFTVYFAKTSATSQASPVKVDGVDAGTVGGSTATPSVWATATVDAGSLGSHTLTIFPPPGNAGNYMRILGVEYTNGDGESVKVTRAGFTGTTTESWVGSGALGSLVSAFDVYRPDIAVVMLGANDFFFDVPPTTTAANLATMIGRARSVDSDALLLVPLPLDEGVYAYGWDEYVAAIHGVGRTEGVPVLDMNERWVSMAQAHAAPFLYQAENDVHPTERGRWDIAQAVADVLLAAARS